MPNIKRINWKRGDHAAWEGWIDGVKLFSIQYAVSRDDEGNAWVLYCKMPGYKDRIYVRSEDIGKRRAQGILEGFVRHISE